MRELLAINVTLVGFKREHTSATGNDVLPSRNQETAMESDPPETKPGETETKRQYGNGSVAQQIIGDFIVALERHPQYADVVARLSVVVCDSKVTEASLRNALFGDLEL